MSPTPFQLPPARLFVILVAFLVSGMSGMVAVAHEEAELGSAALMRDAVAQGTTSTEVTAAIRRVHVAATRWIDSGGRPDLREVLDGRRAALAKALSASVVAEQAGPLLATLDQRIAAAQRALHTRAAEGGAAASWVDDGLEEVAMALSLTMARNHKVQIAAADGILRHHKAWLWGASAISIGSLLVAALVLILHFRLSARREGADAMRDQLVERISDGFFALDRDFRFTHVNHEAARQMRIGAREVLGKNLFEVWPILETSPVGALYREAMAAQAPHTREIAWQALGIWFEVRFFPSAEGLTVFFRDVTEARRMRLALAESEARHRQIVQTAQEGIWILDARGKTSFVNEKLCELLGYGQEEMLGRHLFDFMDREGQRIAAENLSRRALGLNETGDFQLCRKDGTALVALLATSRLTPEGGDVTQESTLVMLTDITRRRTAETERELLLSRERSLRAIAEASQDRYRVLADLVPHVVWTHRADGYVDFVNGTYAERTGQPLDQALGAGWQAVVHPEDLPGYEEKWKQSLLTGEPLEHRVRLRTVDGSWRWHVMRAHAARDADGRLLRWFGLAIDAAPGEPSTDARPSRIVAA